MKVVYVNKNLPNRLLSKCCDCTIDKVITDNGMLNKCSKCKTLNPQVKNDD